MYNKVQVRDPQAIEQVLGDLRQASLTGAGPGEPLVRATALNLIGYAGDRARAEEMACQAAALAELHPSRAIFLGCEPDGAARGWDIVVAAQCHPQIPGYVVCFEAVEIIAHDQEMERLPAVVLTLLLRDLPVVLWWPGDVPMGTPLFEHLLANSDRVVVDADSASDPGDMLRRLAALGHAEHCECAISDLSWGRLTPWRELTAQFFDPVDCRPCLERIQRVRIEYVSSPERLESAQVYLLAAWLATRLGWAPAATVWSKTAEGEQINLQHGRRPVAIELVRVRAMNTEHELRALTLHTGHPQGEATFTIRRYPHDTDANATIQLPNLPIRQRVVPFAVPGTVELLNEELRRLGYDPAYQDALRMAAFFSAQHKMWPARQPVF